MKIVDVKPISVKVNHRGDWIFVLVETDEGITGLGEASQSGDDGLVLAALKNTRQRLLGFDPLNIETVSRSLKTRRMGWMYQIALSAVEQALWDIMGQFLKVPVHTLLGGALRKKIRLYANINRHIQDRTHRGFAAAACRAVDEGFTAIKVAPFDELKHPDRILTGPNASWRAGVERVGVVREAIGDAIELIVDCHGRMEAWEAVMAAEALADFKLLWLEEPLPLQFPEAYRRMSTKVSMPIAAGEYLVGVEGFRPFLMNRLVDIIMPDVKYDGGLMETKLIAGAARMNQVLVAPHCPAGPVSTAASAQVASTISNFLILEYPWGEVKWRANLLDPPEIIENGHLVLSDSPGIGHCLNTEILARNSRN
jgi:galactonate dehydratase